MSLCVFAFNLELDEKVLRGSEVGGEPMQRRDHASRVLRHMFRGGETAELTDDRRADGGGVLRLRRLADEVRRSEFNVNRDDYATLPGQL